MIEPSLPQHPVSVSVSTVQMTPDNERLSWSSATTTAVSSHGVSCGGRRRIPGAHDRVIGRKSVLDPGCVCGHVRGGHRAAVVRRDDRRGTGDGPRPTTGSPSAPSFRSATPFHPGEQAGLLLSNVGLGPARIVSSRLQVDDCVLGEFGEASIKQVCAGCNSASPSWPISRWLSSAC